MSTHKRKFWTEHEEQHLRCLAENYPWHRVASMLGRGESSIRHKAAKIGLTKPSNASWVGTDLGLKLALLRGMGMPFTDISSVLGVSSENLRSAFRRHLNFYEDVWRALLVLNACVILEDIGVSEEDIRLFQEGMDSVYIPRFDLLSEFESSKS